jgi:hypothetical protein
MARCKGIGETLGLGVWGQSPQGTLSIGVAGLSTQMLNNGQSVLGI